MLEKKSKFKPLYKKYIKLRENPQDRRKVLKFKKQKWTSFIEYYKRKLKWYKKFRPKNQDRYVVSRYPNRHTSYSQRYKRTFQSYKKFNFLYGNLLKRFIKRKITLVKNEKIKNSNPEFLRIFEHRLDVILYRAKFCHSLRNAQQLIVHGKVSVNDSIVRIKSYKLKPGDHITINLKYSKLIQSNIRQSSTWPIPPKNLLINYKTLQIIIGDLKHTNFSLLYPFYLNLEKILVNFRYQ